MKKFKIRETGAILDRTEGPDGWYFTTTDNARVIAISPVTLEQLGLHLDPVTDEPRKLYAYYDYMTQLIYFAKEEMDSKWAQGLSCTRAPEYDITYPIDGKDGE